MSTDTAPEFGLAQQGYYRFPSLGDEQIIFVSEDDLWSVGIQGGVARRLSAGLGKVRSTAISRDGKWLAFSSTEEGHSEVYLMASAGGPARRMTYLGCDTRVVGWNAQGEILFASNHQHAFGRLSDLYALSIEHSEIRRIPCGPATHLDMDQEGRLVIARHGGTDLAYWKRYRGGTAGEIWVDRTGRGRFEKLFKKPMNAARPFWIGARIFFISDHEGSGQIYSVQDDGKGLRRHTELRDYFVRGLSVRGTKLIYHAGGDLFILDSETDQTQKINVEYRSPRTQLNRRFVSAVRYLEDSQIHPSEERAVIGARGKVLSLGLFKGPVRTYGGEPRERLESESIARVRLGRYLFDGQRIVLVSDEGGEECLEVHGAKDEKESAQVRKLSGLNLGRTVEMKASPTASEVLLTNHRNELIWVDLEKGKERVLDRNRFEAILGFNWSPDGRWVAYGCSADARSSVIRICEVKTGKIHDVTRAVLRDENPFFDPSGDYLYFVSYREFDPVYDGLHFDLGFPRGSRPYLVTLRKDVGSPFNSDATPRSQAKDAKAEGKADPAKKTSKTKAAAIKAIEIDFEGITDRIVSFPVADGKYGQIAATREKVFFTRFSVKGALNDDWHRAEPGTDAQLEMFDLDTRRLEIIVANLSSFQLSQDGKSILYRAGNALRFIKAGEKPARDTDDHRRGGWLDLERVQIPVRPRSEWRQIYREAWRLQRDHFWTEDMSNVDWAKVYTRYLPLLERVSSRSEVSDVIWEMQGELGTSHAYEIGGDYRVDPHYGIGFLGAEFEFDGKEKGYRLTSVMKGDMWDERCSSPLARAGLGLEKGDILLAIDGRALTRDHHPHQSLVQRAGREVLLTFRRAKAGGAAGKAKSRAPETRAIKTLRSEQYLRYREWVEGNRQFVHEKSKGRIGYLHIPNMGPFGFSEFHRSFLREIDCDGLIVDVRFNGGGHVSQLLLEKLARRRIGYSKSRWFGAHPYPNESPVGPMVALTNEYAGSDGDIFSHAFKLLKLGPLIGKRTWGGVIGISPRHSLFDGGFTTQPEFSYWFQDVGWKVENYGTDPDLEVEYLPSDYVARRDPQLEEGLKVCFQQIKKQPSNKPRFEDFPDLRLPDVAPLRAQRAAKSEKGRKSTSRRPSKT